MRRPSRAIVVSTLAVSLAALPVEPLVVPDGGFAALEAHAETTAATDSAGAAATAASTATDQASPLLITEVQTDQPAGKRYTYTEVYNNSDAPINFKDYVFFYCYEGGMGTGKVFGADASYGKYRYASGDQDLFIDPGKTLVLWQSEGTDGRTVDDFNAFYGTHLIENKDIVRIPYSGIHSTAKRGYFFGKSADQILISAWSNLTGDDIPTGDPDKTAIQYSYAGSGRTCEKSGIAPATPGSVDPSQVPATRVHVDEHQAHIESATADASNGFTVSAEVPYTGTSATSFVTLHYRQAIGSTEGTENTIEMTAAGDGKTFTASIPADKLAGDSVTWYVTANGGAGDTVQSDEQTTPVKPVMPTADSYPPFYITEVAANPQKGQFSYFEVYNASDTPLNLSYFKIFYYYDYPNKTAAQSGKIWTLSDFTTYLQPGHTMVYWLSNDGSTVDDFNDFYGTDLELGKNIVKVNYAGLHGTDNRWIRFGTSEDDAFSLAAFNTADTGRTSSGTAIEYAYPRGDHASQSIPIDVEKATPGTVEDWQKAPITAKFAGYTGYPADDGNPPTLSVNQEEGLTVPSSINEGDDLKVMYDTDLLLGATGADRIAAFKNNVDPDNPDNYPGGSEALKNRPYLLGTEILYKLDDDSDWTSVRQRTQWRLGHFLMQIPSDVLFGHDKVTYKVRAYTLYGMSETPENTVAINRLQNKSAAVRLNVNDGDIVSGTKAITANDGASNEHASITIDGAAANDSNLTLENGAWFMVKTAGMDSYFKDAVTAPYGDDPRNILTIMGSWCESPTSRAIHVDNKYFTYNAEKNTYDVSLTIWAGDSGTPFEEIYDEVKSENHEDFNVSGLALSLENGKTYLPTSIAPDNAKTNTSTALDAVHTIGDSAGMETHLTATFSIPAAEATAQGATIDTTNLSDGLHTVTATANGNTTTANIIVDNTKPDIDFGIDDTQTLYKAFTLDASRIATDNSGIKSLDVMLDGSPIDLPSSIVPHDMEPGTHTIKATAVDNAGNIAQKSLTFTTDKDDPAASDAQTSDIESAGANLSVDVANAPADVTFYEGSKLTEDNGGIVAAKGQGKTSTTSAGSAPYQLYRLDAAAVADNGYLQVNWSGSTSSTDAGHPVTLFSYNAATSSWDSVATAEDGAISARIPASYAAGGHAYLAVQQVTANTGCTAPSLSDSMFDLQPSDDAASNSATANTADAASPASASSDSQAFSPASADEPVQSSWDGTGRPDSYDFCFAWETDTQYYTESFPYLYKDMNQWIVDNASPWNIRYVLHTGDIVDDYDMKAEWENADSAMKILDDAGMPYGILGGNHDVAAGMEKYDNYWKYFGTDRFANKSYYGGTYKNNLGHYDLLTEDGQDFIVLYMSWDIYTDEIDWMNQVLAQYPDRKAIIALHRYTNVPQSDQMLDYTGKLLQNEVVAKNPNVFCVLNGHYHGSSMQTDSFDDNGDGTPDRTVYQIVTDYQSDAEGGSDYLKFLYFDLKNNKVYINSYSPYRNDFNYYDSPKLASYGPGTRVAAQDIAELDVPFTTSQQSLTTDSLTVDAQTIKKIGSVSQAQGTAHVKWTGLDPNTTYGWYAELSNDRDGITRTPVSLFTTDDAGSANPGEGEHTDQSETGTDTGSGSTTGSGGSSSGTVSDGSASTGDGSSAGSSDRNGTVDTGLSTESATPVAKGGSAATAPKTGDDMLPIAGTALVAAIAGLAATLRARARRRIAMMPPHGTRR